MKAKASRGFTLIELLVVISIIALLSSIVLASLNAARDKARLAAGKQFAAHVDRVAGDQAVGVWDFDECSGTTAGDRSGFGKHGSVVTGSTWSADTPTGRGCSLSFNGTTGYVNLGTGTLGPLLSGSSAVTMSVWFKYSSLNSGDPANFLMNAAINGGSYGPSIFLYDGGDGLARVGGWSRSAAADAAQKAVSSTPISPNTWTHAAVVSDFAGGKIHVYVNGALAASASATFGSPTYVHGSPTSTDRLGGGGSSSYWYDGSIDSARYYAKGLTASEIGKLYAEGSSAMRHAYGRP